MIQGLVPLNNWLTTGLETQVLVAVVDKVGLFPWLGSGDFSYLTLMAVVIFPFLLRFLATNDSLKRLGIFCQSDARTQSMYRHPLQMARGTLKMLLPAALKYAPNSAAFFFWRLGTRLTLSCVCQCFDVVSHSLRNTTFFEERATNIEAFLRNCTMSVAMSFWFILPSALFVVMINGRVLLKAGFLFWRENLLFGKWVSLSISAWLASKLLCLWEHAAFLYSASLYDFRNYTTAS